MNLNARSQSGNQDSKDMLKKQDDFDSESFLKII